MAQLESEIAKTGFESRSKVMNCNFKQWKYGKAGPKSLGLPVSNAGKLARDMRQTNWIYSYQLNWFANFYYFSLLCLKSKNELAKNQLS